MALHPKTCAALSREHRDLIALCEATNGSNPMHMCKAYYRQLEVPSYAQLCAVSIPVLIFCGEADQIASPDGARRLHAALDSSMLHVVSQASHMVMQEQPELVNELINTWLAQVLPPSRQAT